MNAKIALALAALSYVPLAVAGNEAAYPKEKVRVPAEERKRKEDTRGLRIHGAEDG